MTARWVMRRKRSMTSQALCECRYRNDENSNRNIGLTAISQHDTVWHWPNGGHVFDDVAYRAPPSGYEAPGIPHRCALSQRRPIRKIAEGRFAYARKPCHVAHAAGRRELVADQLWKGSARDPRQLESDLQGRPAHPRHLLGGL